MPHQAPQCVVTNWTNEEGTPLRLPPLLASGVFAGNAYSSDWANAREDAEGKSFGEELETHRLGGRRGGGRPEEWHAFLRAASSRARSRGREQGDRRASPTCQEALLVAGGGSPHRQGEATTRLHPDGPCASNAGPRQWRASPRTVHLESRWITSRNARGRGGQANVLPHSRQRGSPGAPSFTNRFPLARFSPSSTSIAANRTCRRRPPGSRPIWASASRCEPIPAISTRVTFDEGLRGAPCGPAARAPRLQPHGHRERRVPTTLLDQPRGPPRRW